VATENLSPPGQGSPERKSKRFSKTEEPNCEPNVTETSFQSISARIASWRLLGSTKPAAETKTFFSFFLLRSPCRFCGQSRHGQHNGASTHPSSVIENRCHRYMPTSDNRPHGSAADPSKPGPVRRSPRISPLPALDFSGPVDPSGHQVRRHVVPPADLPRKVVKGASALPQAVLVVHEFDKPPSTSDSTLVQSCCPFNNTGGEQFGPAAGFCDFPRPRPFPAASWR